MRKFSVFNPLNPVVAFGISYFAFLLFGPLVKYLTIGLNNEELRLINYLILYLSLFIVGYGIAQFIINNPKTEKHINLDSKILVNKKNSVLFITLGNLGFIFLFIVGGGIPLFSENAETARIQFASGKGEFILIFTALIYYGTIKYLSFNSHSRIKIFFLTTTSTCNILFLGWRSPAAYYFILVGLTIAANSEFYRKNNRVKYSFYLVPPILLFAASLIGLMRANIKVSSFQNILVNINHLFLVNFDNLRSIMSGFKEMDYQLGYTYINDFLVAIPGSSNRFTGVWMKEYLGKHFAGETMTITIVGESYINFGYYGGLLTALILGVIISFLREYSMRLIEFKRNLLIVLICIFCFRIITGGLLPILIFTIIPITIIWILDLLKIKL